MYDEHAMTPRHDHFYLVEFVVHICDTKRYVDIDTSFHPSVQEEPNLNCSRCHLYDNPTLRGQEAT